MQSRSPRIYQVHGIILKRRNMGEADRIITLFTREYGKIRVIAKGIRRITSRRASHLEVFRLVDATIHKGKTLDYVTEVQSTSLMSIASRDIQKISFAYYICELIDRLLPEHQEHANVFDLATDAFCSLDWGEGIVEWQQNLVSFALELLWVLGYLPRTTTLAEENIQSYVEGIIERKLRAPAILTKMILTS